MGEVISSIGLPKNTNKNLINHEKSSINIPLKDPNTPLSCPQSCIIFAFTGNGNVTKGSKEIFELLPHEYITTEELPLIREQVEQGLRCGKKVYGVSVTLDDLVRLKKVKDVNGSKHDKNQHSRTEDESKVFSSTSTNKSVKRKICKFHYYSNPDQYESIFHTTIAPHVSVIVNGIYWDFRYPRLLTKKQLVALRSTGNNNLKVVADITCDVTGSFEFLSHTTDIEKPFYTFLPESDTDLEGVDKNGVLMLGTECR